MKEENEILKELACGIATTDPEAYVHYYGHPDYNTREDAFVVKTERGNLFEVKVTSLKKKMSNSSLNDVVVQFAMLWGQTIGSAVFGAEVEVAEDMKQYDSEELLKLLSLWAEEYFAGDNEDTVEFFETKLDELYPNLNTEE